MLFPNFSLLMSVYINDRPDYLKNAIDSVLNQTLCPSEIVIVLDGAIHPQCYNLIVSYTKTYPGLFKIVPLEINRGLGVALNIGIDHCQYDLIARMDSDDICYQNRFERMIATIIEDKDTAVLGCSIQEFAYSPGDLNSYRHLPVDNQKLIQFSKFRSPLNHPTVLFKKDKVINAGSYLDMPLFEDYYLWVRMILKGYKIKNMHECLLHFRVGNDMIGRRHGWGYIKKEVRFLTVLRNLNYINIFQFITLVTAKLPLRLLPKSLLKLIYRTLLR